jgi:hypothetical protein
MVALLISMVEIEKGDQGEKEEEVYEKLNFCYRKLEKTQLMSVSTIFFFKMNRHSINFIKVADCKIGKIILILF